MRLSFGVCAPKVFDIFYRLSLSFLPIEVNNAAFHGRAPPSASGHARRHRLSGVRAAISLRTYAPPLASGLFNAFSLRRQAGAAMDEASDAGGMAAIAIAAAASVVRSSAADISSDTPFLSS